jgi:acyl-CoA dehydrogenase
MQQALDGVIRNFPNRPMAWLLGRFVFPFGRRFRVPSDRLGHQVASLLLVPSDARDRLTKGMYIPKDLNEPIGRLEDALPKVIAAEPLERKIHRALDSQAFVTRDYDALIGEALRLGVLNDDEANRLRAAFEARHQVIQVDDFPASSTLVSAIERADVAGF